MRDLPFDELLSAYFDGETSPEETERVEQRLAASPELRRQLEELVALSDLVRVDLARSVPLHPAPHDFAAGVAARAALQKLSSGEPVPHTASLEASDPLSEATQGLAATDGAAIERLPSLRPGSGRVWKSWFGFVCSVAATAAAVVVLIRTFEQRPHETSTHPEALAKSSHRSGDATDRMETTFVAKRDALERSADSSPTGNASEPNAGRLSSPTSDSLLAGNREGWNDSTSVARKSGVGSPGVGLSGSTADAARNAKSELARTEKPVTEKPENDQEFPLASPARMAAAAQAPGMSKRNAPDEKRNAQDGTQGFNDGVLVQNATSGFLGGLNGIPIGHVIPYFKAEGDKVAVVELTVVDSRVAADTVQYLLMENSVAPLDGVPTSLTLRGPSPQVKKSAGPADAKSREMAKGDAGGFGGGGPGNFSRRRNPDLGIAPSDPQGRSGDGPVAQELAIFVESTEEQLAAMLNELEKLEQPVVVGARLQPPLALASVDSFSMNHPSQTNGVASLPRVERSQSDKAAADPVASIPVPKENRQAKPQAEKAQDEKAANAPVSRPKTSDAGNAVELENRIAQNRAVESQFQNKDAQRSIDPWGTRQKQYANLLNRRLAEENFRAAENRPDNSPFDPINESSIAVAEMPDALKSAGTSGKVAAKEISPPSLQDAKPEAGSVRAGAGVPAAPPAPGFAPREDNAPGPASPQRGGTKVVGKRPMASDRNGESKQSSGDLSPIREAAERQNDFRRDSGRREETLPADGYADELNLLAARRAAANQNSSYQFRIALPSDAKALHGEAAEGLAGGGVRSNSQPGVPEDAERLKNAVAPQNLSKPGDKKTDRSTPAGSSSGESATEGGHGPEVQSKPPRSFKTTQNDLPPAEPKSKSEKPEKEKASEAGPAKNLEEFEQRKLLPDQTAADLDAKRELPASKRSVRVLIVFQQALPAAEVPLAEPSQDNRPGSDQPASAEIPSQAP